MTGTLLTRQFSNKLSWLLKLFAASVACVAFCIGPQIVHAQEHPVHWTLKDVPDTAPVGSWESIQVSAVIDSGWHIYGLTQSRPPIATAIQVGPEALVTGRGAEQPRPIRRFDDAFGIEAEFFETAASFRAHFAIVAGTAPGKRDLSIRVKYQTCTSSVCLPPTTETLPFAVNVTPAVKGHAASVGTALSRAATPLVLSTKDNGTGKGKDVGGEGNGAGVAPVSPAASPATSAPSPDFIAPEQPAGAVPAASGEAPTTTSATIPAAVDDGIQAYLMLAAAMGALALLTPCVFPMIPITVSYFTKRAAGATGTVPRSTVVHEALVYGAGIVVAFSGLGLLLALAFGATGINRFAANPWLNLIVAALFLTFGLDLMGAIHLRLPWRLVARMNPDPDRRSVVGLLFMGLAFTVTTFTCTVPFVGTLLVSAATGQWLWPALGMLVFSSVFAVPFVVLAIFPALLTALPRSGNWMDALKVTLGVIELGAAFKFLSNADLVWQLGLLSRSAVLAIWTALALLAALYLLGQVQLRHEVAVGGSAGIGPGVGVGRMMAGGCFIAVALFLATGLFAARANVGAFEAFLPPSVYPGDETSTAASSTATGSAAGLGSPAAHELTWDTNYEHALTAARAAGRPVFIDFTGYTCTNCRWMEANVFSRADIEALLRQYTLVRLYTDGDGSEYERNQQMQLKRFGTVALPFYAILAPTAPQGSLIATFPGLTRQPTKFASFLQRGLQVAQRVAHAL